MKKILLSLFLLTVFSCASPVEDDETELGIISPDNVVRIEISTSEPNDEIFLNYYQYETDDYSLLSYAFNYNSQGVAEPITITLNNYNFRFIQGETYRKRSENLTPLLLKIYLNDEVIVEKTSIVSDTNANGLIRFNYDIKKQESI
ncbi:hypothetical protein [Polaribacter sp.]|uniref:hypothetical protein n=1 Tax=Polaribacter sp. TaxID=1920175 RepID=UPI003F6CE2AA